MELLRGNPRHKIFGYFSQNLWIMDYKVCPRDSRNRECVNDVDIITLLCCLASIVENTEDL